jgi:DNA-binding winged helix-turn-helix (wHTH) protein
MYRFDSFQLDPRSHELRRDGLRIKIPEQCFVVLLTLLERPGQRVTREELARPRDLPTRSSISMLA